jgi:Fe-S cluster assembly protein SufD
MTVAADNEWLASLLAGAPKPARPDAWLSRVRGEALERAHALRLPTLREEAWRFTDIAPLYELAFRPVAPAVVPAGLALEPVIAPEAPSRVVFVDGQFMPALSTVANERVVVTTLAAGVAAHAELVQSHLTQRAPFHDDPLCAINTAQLADGALVVARRGAPASPVQLMFVATQPQVATQPRCLIVAEDGADLAVIEDYVGLTDGAYYVNAVTEIAVGANARVRHTRRQQDGVAAFHTATCAVRLARDADYESVAVALGARLSRYNLRVSQADAGARCRLDGLALIDGRQLADTHSFIDHAAPDCTSRQLHKCVVGDHGHAVFNGVIMVRPGAQRTDSAQQSRNLLLGERAHVDTKPQLEIFADDVKCAHGATVGQLDAEELFYLRARGLSEPAARALLTYGFAADIVDRIPFPSVVTALRRAVLHRTEGKEAA